MGGYLAVPDRLELGVFFRVLRADEVGLNMGAKWTDGTGMNENGILLNGCLHKIHEDIVFEYDDGIS